MEGSKKGIVEKEATSYLEKIRDEYAAYLKGKYFSDKDIYGDNIFEEVVIGGQTLKISRLSPTRSYADPVAYLNEKAALVNKKPLADTRNTEDRSETSRRGPREGGLPLSRLPPLTIRDTSAGKQIGSSGMQLDEDDDSSESLEEISEYFWKKAMSAKKQAESGAGPSSKRH